MHRIKKADFLSASALHQEYLRRYQKRVTKIRVTQWIIFLSFIFLWEFSTRVGWLNAFIFSSPSRVIECFVSMAKDGSVFYHIGVTLFETFVSFGLVIGIGLLVAVLLWWNDSIAKVLEPYLVVLNSLPKSALAPVFIVWLGNNMKTIIVAAVTVGKVKLVQCII